jgi:hypothetical protein
MTPFVRCTALAAALVLPILAAPATASASCGDRKAVGTVVGGVSGALIGNSIASGGGGAVVGGLGGAVLGHEIARGTCGHARHAYYQGQGGYTRERYVHGHGHARAMTAAYDARGGSGAAAATPADAPGPGACHMQTISYYDDRGVLAQRPVQTCSP